MEEAMRLHPVIWPLAFVTVAILPTSLVWYPGIRSSGVAPSGQEQTGWVATSNPPVPIVAGAAEQRDVPIYVFGLGTVQAFNRVTVSSRVDGQLQKLAFREGQEVRAGDVLAQLDPRPFQAALREAEANLRRDQAQLQSARAQLERILNLATRDFASRVSVDAQRALVVQFEASVEADQAQIDHAKVQLEYTSIRSPISGRTGLRVVDEGNMIRAADPTGIVVVMQLQPIAVIFALPEDDLPKINDRLAAGDPPTVTAFGRDGQTILAVGALATIDNTIDRKTGTFKLKAYFTNERHTLWPGQFVDARLHLSTRKGGVVVSEAAVQRGPEGTHVFVIAPDNTVAMRVIKVAQTQNGAALVDEGLRPGERVVVEGQHRLEPGSRVIEAKPERPSSDQSGGSGSRPAKS
jgi:multidrug efflux system membrane fusion protein